MAHSQNCTFSGSRLVTWQEGARRADVRSFVESALAGCGSIPDGALVKPNLNNDLMPLTGNSVDFRVLVPLVEALIDMGVKDLAVADGFNVGMDRRGIDGMRRLRIDRLAARYRLRAINLNTTDAVEIPLHSGAIPVARCVVECPFLINVAKIKTHAEATLSCALKNWVGICVGQSKRRMHDALSENIVHLNEQVPPRLVLVDGLVAMEGNGPGDGQPARMDLLATGRDGFSVDLVVAALAGFAPEEVPYLRIARDRGLLDAEDFRTARTQIAAVRPLRRAPPRPTLAIISASPRLLWLKRALRPFVNQGIGLRVAHRLGVVQDVYHLTDDAIHDASIAAEDEALHRDVLREACPRGWDTIATRVRRGDRLHPFESPDCLRCLNCYWAAPNDAVRLTGRPGHLSLQAKKYKSRIEALYGSPATHDAT